VAGKRDLEKASAEPLSERDLSRWKLIEDFRARLAEAVERVAMPRSESDPRRRLLSADYFSLLLFGLFNPVVRTMRGLCEATKLGRVQRQISSAYVSLGSFSEAQAVFAPEVLEQVIKELGAEAARRGHALSGIKPAQWQALIVDSSLFRALPRMAWALWRHQGVTQRAVRLHVKYDLAANAPVEARVSPGRECERRAWRGLMKKGELYVGDRYYGEDYALLMQAKEAGCAFVVRLRQHRSVRVIEELALSPEDHEARVVRSARVMLGGDAKAGPFVLVEVAGDKEPLLLLSSLESEQLPAQGVALLYRQRWMVELFFRWIKCLLGCRHWLAESERGVAMQVYCALIAALLLALYSGKRPGRRAMELIQFYLLGYATLEEVSRQLGLSQKNS
jgi:Transposase DDE domain